MLEKIHIFISIIAALVVTIVSILEGAMLPVLALRLIVVIVLFFVIGIFVRSYLKSYVFIEENSDNQDSLDENFEDGLDTDMERNDNFDSESKL